MAKKETPDIPTILASHLKTADFIGDDDNRADLLRGYFGELYGDEVKGKSQVIASDISDAVETIFPEVLEIFTSGQKPGKFDAVGPEDEDKAEQETDVVNHILMQKNKGYLILTSWLKEALIQQNAYVESCWQEKETSDLFEYEGLDQDEALRVYERMQQFNGDIEIVEQSGGPSEEGFEPLDIKIRLSSSKKEYVVESFPHHEFFLTPQWESVSLDGVPCCGRRRDMRVSVLWEMGFDKASVAALPDAGTSLDEDESALHDTKDHFDYDEDDNLDPAMREVEVCRTFLRLDKDGDGKVRLYEIWSGVDGKTILKYEDGSEAIREVDGIPYTGWTPYIIPHRHVGRSVAELVDDVQRIKTVLMRITLDNTYATNYQRPFVKNATRATLEDLLNPAAGAPIRGDQDTVVEWSAPPSVAGNTLPLIELANNMREERTGATRYAQGLDADSLNKTATGIGKIMAAGQKKMLLIARNFAETGLRELFLKIHRDLRKGPMQEIAVKLRGEWIQVDPTDWRDRTDMTPVVGLGNGDMETKQAGLGMIAGYQEKLVSMGSGMVTEKEVFNTLEKLVQTVGFKSAQPFFVDPETVEPQPPQPEPPDPMMFAAETDRGRLELDKMKAQEETKLAMFKAETERMKMQLSAQENDRKQSLDEDKAVAKDDLDRDKMELDAAVNLSQQQINSITEADRGEFGA